MEIKTIQIDSDTFLVFKGTQYIQVNVEDIVMLETFDKYILIKTKYAEEYIVGCSLTNITKLLCSDYITVAKGFLVNKKYIRALLKKNNDKGKYRLILNNSKYTREVSSYTAKKILEQL